MLLLSVVVLLSIWIGTAEDSINNDGEQLKTHSKEKSSLLNDPANSSDKLGRPSYIFLKGIMRQTLQSQTKASMVDPEGSEDASAEENNHRYLVLVRTLLSKTFYDANQMGKQVDPYSIEFISTKDDDDRPLLALVLEVE